MQQVAVLGLGQFGNAVARALAPHAEVLAIDADQAKVDAVKDEVTSAVVLNVTDRTTLEHFVKKSIDCIIVSLGDSLESAVLAVLYAREIGIERIVVKSNSPDHGRILELVGATQVIFPEVAQAERLARQLVRPNLLDYLPLTEGFSIGEVKAPESFEGKTLVETNLRKNYGLSVIAIRRRPEPGQKEGKIEVELTAETRIAPGDTLIVIGRDKYIAKLQEAE